MQFVVNTDGASRGNPGPASYGFIIKNPAGVILHQEGKTIGVNTNNVAEYSAVKAALEYIYKRFSKNTNHQIKIIADSRLIVEQLSGNFKIKNANLKIIFDQIKDLENKLGSVNYEHCRREFNFIADRLANKALDEEPPFSHK